MKIISVSAFDGALQLIWPLFFATTALLVFLQSDDPDAVVYAGLGAAAMGTWSTVVTSASDAIQRERSQGTLELLVTTPASLAAVLVPSIAAMATIASYSMVATLLWARFVFGVVVPISSPALFVLSVLATIVAVSMFGFWLAVVAVRYRSAWALGNLLEYPGWLLCGFLVPLTLFPDWVRPVSWVLPPTWGMDAMRDAALGGSPWAAIGACLGLGAVYAVVAAVIAEKMLLSARRTASLSLR